MTVAQALILANLAGLVFGIGIGVVLARADIGEGD